MANEFVIKNGFISQDNSSIIGTLTATTITASTISGGTLYGDGSNLTGIGGGSFTGGTVTGPTVFTNGLTANTISATTYQNLPISGALILLSTQETQITGTANSTGIFSYTVASNTYSRIMVESEVGWRGNANLNTNVTFELQYGGVTKRDALIEFDATGAGDQFAAGYTLKYSESFTGGGVVRINTTGVLQGTWTVESFRVYGII